jgi:hypothetical protein
MRQRLVLILTSEGLGPHLQDLQVGLRAVPSCVPLRCCAGLCGKPALMRSGEQSQLWWLTAGAVSVECRHNVLCVSVK